MPGKVARNLARILTDLYVGQSRSAVDAAGQVLVDVLYAYGGVTTIGAAYAPNAQYATWIAVGAAPLIAFSPGMTTLGYETARVSASALAGSGATSSAVAVLDASAWNGWIWELGVFSGGTAALNSGNLIGYSQVPPFLKTAQKQVVLQWSAQTGVP